MENSGDHLATLRKAGTFCSAKISAASPAALVACSWEVRLRKTWEKHGKTEAKCLKNASSSWNPGWKNILSWERYIYIYIYNHNIYIYISKQIQSSLKQFRHIYIYIHTYTYISLLISGRNHSSATALHDDFKEHEQTCWHFDFCEWPSLMLHPIYPLC